MADPSLDDVLPLHLATVTFPDDHPLRGQTGEVLGFAIRHRRGVVLFDTGIGSGSRLIDRLYQPARHSLEDALAAHGHGLDEVTAIVNSHLHFDHCGNNPLLPGVPIYVQAGELEAARGEWYTVPDWVDFPGAAYRVVDGEARVERGMRIVATPGHTGGHQSLVLDATGGPIVLAGQAIYSKAEYEHLAAHGRVVGDDQAEPEAYIASANHLASLEPRRVHFSHDIETWTAD